METIPIRCWFAIGCITIVLYDSLFGPSEEKVDNGIVAEAFRSRVKDAAGFTEVPEPLPMRNSQSPSRRFLNE